MYLDKGMEEDTVIQKAENRQIALPRYQTQPSNWKPDNVPADWLDKLEAMLLNSALTTGASVDPQGNIITGQAAQMAQHLRLSGMPYEALDYVYTRWLLEDAIKPEWRGQMVTSHALLSCWHRMEAEMKAAEAAEHERALNEYKARQAFALRTQPRELIKVDGHELSVEQVDWRKHRRAGYKPKGVPPADYPVPPPDQDLSSGAHRALGIIGTSAQYAPGEPEQPQEARKPSDQYLPTDAELEQDTTTLERRRNQASNEASWHTLLADHEQQQDRKERHRKGKP